MYIFYFFVYFKKYTIESVCVSGRPSGREHDNCWEYQPIVMKFSVQNPLMNISVEFVDEDHRTSGSRVIAKILIFTPTPLGLKFRKKVFVRKCLKNTLFDSAFYADFKYGPLVGLKLHLHARKFELPLKNVKFLFPNCTNWRISRRRNVQQTWRIFHSIRRSILYRTGCRTWPSDIVFLKF